MSEKNKIIVEKLTNLIKRQNNLIIELDKVTTELKEYFSKKLKNE